MVGIQVPTGGDDGTDDGGDLRRRQTTGVRWHRRRGVRVSVNRDRRLFVLFCFVVVVVVAVGVRGSNRGGDGDDDDDHNHNDKQTKATTTTTAGLAGWTPLASHQGGADVFVALAGPPVKTKSSPSRMAGCGRRTWAASQVPAVSETQRGSPVSL